MVDLYSLTASAEWLNLWDTYSGNPLICLNCVDIGVNCAAPQPAGKVTAKQ